MLKKLLYTISGIIIIGLSWTGIAYAQLTYLTSKQLAPTPSNGNCLITDGKSNVWSLNCGSGGGASGIGGWTFIPAAIYNSTTTDQVLVDETATSSLAKLEVNGNMNLISGNSYEYNGVKIANASTTLENYFFGGNAGNLSPSMTGNALTAVGWQALKSDTTGYDNTANGTNALVNVTTGYSNTGDGYNVLESLTSGNTNTAMGLNANQFSTIGLENESYGDGALQAAVTGRDNVALGYGASYTNNATDTVAVGNFADFGEDVLSPPGYYNQGGVFLGYQSGWKEHQGNYNSFIGFNSGDDVSDGSYNIILGQNATVPSITGNGQLNIGNTIFGTGMYSGALVSSSTSGGNIGIGTTSPFTHFAISGSKNDTTSPFAISTSSPTATTTALLVDNNGNLSLLSGSYLTLSALRTSAGAFLAVNPTGQVIATTTPAGGGGGSGTVTQVNYTSPNSTLAIGGSGCTTVCNLTSDLNLNMGNQWLASTTFLGGLNSITSTSTNATSTNLFATNASTTNFYGAGLFSCNGASNALTWSNGQYGCNTISGGGTVTTLTAGTNVTFSSGATCTTTCTINAASGGSGTVNSGTTGQNAYYSSSGTAVSGTSTLIEDTTSNVGIASTTPSGLLSIAERASQTSPILIVSSSTPGYATSTAFEINQFGMATIGTSTPAAVSVPLTVAGTGQSIAVFENPLGSPELTISNGGLLTGGALNMQSMILTSGANSTPVATILGKSGQTADLFDVQLLSKSTITESISAAGLMGLSSTTPWAQLSIGVPVYSATQPMFAIGSSTASGTSTPFEVDNNARIVNGNSGVVNLASGLATVNTSVLIDSKTIIFLTSQTACTGFPEITATTTKSFSITSSALTDTCEVGWQIIQHP